MTTSVLSVPTDAPLAEVARVLFTGGVRALPVLDGDRAPFPLMQERRSALRRPLRSAMWTIRSSTPSSERS
jgi:CBS domain-containing protein